MLFNVTTTLKKGLSLVLMVALASLQGCQTTEDSSSGGLDLVTSLLNLAQTTIDYKEAKNQSQARQQQALADSQARDRAAQQRQAQLIEQQRQAQQQVNLPQPSNNVQTSSNNKSHDPNGEAHNCVRWNTADTFGGFTNTCAYAISVIHCLSGEYKEGPDSYAFPCTRPGGLWAKQATAGEVRAGGTDRTSLPRGSRISWFACRDPYSIHNARYENNRIVAACVR